MAKITLGGERLGQGDKIQVNIPNFERSSHDIGRVFTTDQAFGTLVPAFCEIGLRGDVFYFDDIESLVRTLPTKGPVFGLTKMQVDVFKAPLRLYVGPLHNNATGIGLKMNQVKLPVERHITTTGPKDVEETVENPAIKTVSPDSLQHYLGLKASPVGDNFGNKPYNTFAGFKLMYWDVYKNYYANKQEEEGVVIAFSNDKTVTLTGFTVNKGAAADAPVWNPNTNKWEADSSTIINQTITIQLSGKVASETVGKLMLYDGFKKQYISLASWAKFQNASGDGLTQTWVTKAVFTSKAGDNNVIENVILEDKNDIQTYRFPLKNIDDMREKILGTGVGDALIIDKNTPTPYGVDLQQWTDENGYLKETMAKPMCGLGIKTHLSDMYNNWLQTDWLDGENGINDLTSIDTTSGSFTINEFILDYKLFRMMNRIAISDGSYDAWQTAVYGEEGPVRTESPVYIGGYSCEIGFEEVVSKSATTEEPLGSLAGRGATQQQTRKGGRNIKIKCDEASLIMVLVSFTPRLTYPANNGWWTKLQTMDDFHKPDLDGIAFQNLTDGQLMGIGDVINGDGSERHMVIGKQTSWVEYTTAVNETHGDFVPGKGLQHMVFNRRYRTKDETSHHVANYTTYIDPTEFDIPFADTRLSAKPFWVQIGFNVTARRKMSAQQVPVL
ncbi:major capsid protein [Dipodfec virus UOA04_Rod_661]|nr:major capsid protein [Dipodfec virus UOA04_Rod_661]